ncbi:uncharacterized protein LOC113336045 [Papaver somniferum]|uniref:uncharacterized protein LOC113336045 n=1 Tax=Papaver somniferum TaxID=3469 RepID=UPI000E70501C|nr:uncharacterized protein LOC113336045 [Papaver somniferum]
MDLEIWERKRALWRQIIHEKFGGNPESFLPNSFSKIIGSSLWAGMLKARDHVKLHTNFIIKNGHNILFWKDPWNGNQTFQMRFPSLFKLSRKRDVIVAQMINEYGAWDLDFRRNVKEEEVGEVTLLLQVTGEPLLSSDNDQWQWKHKIFYVANCYSTLDLDGYLSFPHKQIWNARVPLKVSFLVWTLCHKGAPTLDYLYRAGKVQNPECLFCAAAVETGDHLFLHFKETAKLWSYFLDSFGLSWTFSQDVKSTIWEWKNKKGRKMIKKIWGLLPFAIWWTIWNERNNKLYSVKKRHLNQLIVVVKCTLYNWALQTKLFVGFSLSTFICNWETVMGTS